MGTSWAIDRKPGQRRVVLAYEILFLFFSNRIVCSDVMNDIIQSLTMYTLIIKQAQPKYSDSYIFNWHSKFATKSGCFTLLSDEIEIFCGSFFKVLGQPPGTGIFKLKISHIS